jgi:AraC-like DNA-binding protein
MAIGGKTLSILSHDQVFSDHAHMSRSFARATGLSPSAYRSLIAGKV